MLKVSSKVIGLGKASGMPGIIRDPTGEHGESSEKEEKWRSWESKEW